MRGLLIYFEAKMGFFFSEFIVVQKIARNGMGRIYDQIELVAKVKQIINKNNK